MVAIMKCISLNNLYTPGCFFIILQKTAYLMCVAKVRGFQVLDKGCYV